MVNDHLSDFITRVRNGYLAHKKEIEVPLVKIILKVAEVMKAEGYFEKVEVSDNRIVIALKYNGREPVITGIRRISKPGSRVYSGSGQIPKVWGGLGKSIITTPKGVMSDKEAKKLKAGGEIICQIW